MEFSTREITTKEYEEITADFKKIEHKFGIQDVPTRRLNRTVLEDGKVVGFASGLVYHKWFFLSDLWIQENYRGQGLGAKTLKMLELDVCEKGIWDIYTWTTSYNSNDLFYEKQGYEKCLVFENYFEIENGHHICLRKAL